MSFCQKKCALIVASLCCMFTLVGTVAAQNSLEPEPVGIPYSSSFGMQDPAWTPADNVAQPVWEKYGLRPKVFPEGSQGYRAPAAKKPAQKASATPKKPVATSKKPEPSAPPSVPSSKSGPSTAASTATTQNKPAPPPVTVPPYSGNAPATGAADGADTATADTDDVLHPPLGGVTHTRASSATQTNALLSNRIEPSVTPPAPGASLPPPAPVRQQPAPTAPVSQPAPTVSPPAPSPQIVMPNNSLGNLTDPSGNI